MAVRADKKINNLSLRQAWYVYDPDGNLLSGPYFGKTGEEKAANWAQQCLRFCETGKRRVVRHGG